MNLVAFLDIPNTRQYLNRCSISLKSLRVDRMVECRGVVAWARLHGLQISKIVRALNHDLVPLATT